MARKKYSLYWTQHVYTIFKNYNGESTGELFRKVGISEVTIRKIKRYYDLSKSEKIKEYLKKVPYLNFSEVQILSALSSGKEMTCREISLKVGLPSDLTRAYLTRFDILGLIKTNPAHNFTRQITKKGLRTLEIYKKIFNLLKEIKRG